MNRVLVVEDEESFADALSYTLRQHGFAVTVATTGAEAIDEYHRLGADIVLLDLILPDISGNEVCRRLRSRSSVPIIMVTARDSEVDKVVGLELGADDYVTKPYSGRELIARIHAVLRRSAAAPTEPAATTLVAGCIHMDLNRHSVTVRGKEIGLPMKEFQLLENLLRAPGMVVSRDQLISRVWGPDYVGDTKTLDVHIKRLRTKIETAPGRPQLIVTVRGMGYRLESAEHADELCGASGSRAG